MTKKIAMFRIKGGTGLVRPVHDACTLKEAKKNVPAGVPFWLVDASEVDTQWEALRQAAIAAGEESFDMNHLEWDENAQPSGFGEFVEPELA